MNSCHVCNTIPRKDQVFACDNCENNYCLKCIKTHLNEPSIQKTFIICNFDTIKQKKRAKSWKCFSCNNQCLCMPCKGSTLVSIEKQLLGKKQIAPVKRKIQDFQKYFPQIELFKDINFAQLSPFEQEYFMNKAMLYCRKNESELPTKKTYDQPGFKHVPQRVEAPNQNVIEIDSEQNGAGQQQIDQQDNQDQQDNIQANQQHVAMDLQGEPNDDLARKNPEVIDKGKNNEDNDKIVEEPKQDIVPQKIVVQDAAILAVENDVRN